MTKLDFLEEELQDLKDRGQFLNIRTIESAMGPWIQVDGHKVLNLCTYMTGFTPDPPAG